MRTDVKLSTKFLTTQNAHQVGLLTTLVGEMPTTRPPINVALVLDRSGSMGGRPLAAAKESAMRFATFLGTADRASVVAFDDEVRTVYGPGPGGDPQIAEAIARIESGGSTNLSGGWLRGVQLVQSGLVDGTNRVVLLTDGQANAGIADGPTLINMASGGASARVSTTCIGFGAEFNEELLQPMARAGGGNYWYVERDDQMAGIFSGEIEGLVALAAQNVEVEVSLRHASTAGVTFLQSYPVTKTPQGTWRATLGDLYATTPLALGLVFHVEDVGLLGKTSVAEVRIEADIVTATGIEHRTTVMPVVANLDGTDHIEPTVEQVFLRFEVARAREEAVRLADGGDFVQAADMLREASRKLEGVTDDETLMEEREDLAAEAGRLEQEQYDARERKYLGSRVMAAREMKDAYLKQTRRRPKA